MGKLLQKKKNISEFYKFPVDDFCGSTDFNLYIIKDTNPIDVDLLVSDYYLVKTILYGTSATYNRCEDGENRILNYVTINNKKVLFDFRSVGDKYYDKKLQQDMLDTRIKHKNDFYIPNKEMYLYSLIYHVIIHKPNISLTYLKIFNQNGLKDHEINKKNLKNKLDTWLQKKGYSYCNPEPSVGYFLQF